MRVAHDSKGLGPNLHATGEGGQCSAQKPTSRLFQQGSWVLWEFSTTGFRQPIFLSNLTWWYLTLCHHRLATERSNTTRSLECSFELSVSVPFLEKSNPLRTALQESFFKKVRGVGGELVANKSGSSESV